MPAFRTAPAGTAEPYLRSVVLAALLALAAVVVAWAVLHTDDPALGTRATAWSFVTGLLLLAAQAAAIGVLARSPGDPSAAGTRRGRLLRVGRGVLLGGGLSGLVLAVVVDVPVHPALGTADRIVVRGVLWAALALAVAAAVRRGRPVANRRWVLSAPPAALALAGVLVSALSASLGAGVTLLRTPLLVSAVGALVVVPAVLVASAVEGLQDTRDRGLWLADLIEHRPRTVVVVLALNLVVLALLLVVAQWFHPEWVLVRPDPQAWIAAGVIALVLVWTLTLDRRVGLTTADHEAVGMLLTLVVAVPIAILAALALGLTVVSLLLSRPVVASGLIVLLLGLVLLGRVRRLSDRLWTPVAALLGVVLSLLAQVRAAPVSAARRIADVEKAIAAEGVVVILGCGAVVLAGVVLVIVLVGRPRLLLYLGAVIFWTALVSGVGAWAKGGSLVNVDLVLTALLSVLALLWISGRQAEIDGFEVVLTVVVTATLWLAPLAVTLLPNRFSQWLVVVAVVLPGLTAVWDRVRQLRRGEHERLGETKLERWCLAYTLLAAFVWNVGGAAAALPDQLSTAVLAYLLLPLAMLLVVLTSAGRARSTATAPAPVGRRPRTGV
jgi:hypothetical protein